MRFTTRREVLVLLGKTLLALPVALALWYFASPFLNEMAAHVAKTPIAVLSDSKVGTPVMRGRSVRFPITIYAPYQVGRARAPATTEVDVNPSIYTFGLALFLALSVAAPASRRTAPIVVGVIALSLVPAWGVTFDVLKQLALARELEPYLAFPIFMREGIGLAYQVGALLLPTLVPVALWFGLNQRREAKTAA